MALDYFREAYTGGIREITLGKKDGVTVGGDTAYPFHGFEAAAAHPPRIAMEVWDMRPEDWPPAALAPFEDVADDPAAWARRCVDEFGADMIALLLRSTDPNDRNASPETAVEMVRRVRETISVPLIVWGTTAIQKDEEILKAVAKAFPDERLILGPVEDANHKGIGAAAMGFGHTVVASSPIDVNIAKQVNILLENLGMPMDRVLIDPTTGGLGYGMEYTYSVMERIRMAALVQGDEKLQLPVINNLGFEIWKSKEAKQSVEEAPALGDPERRGILMESVGAVSYLLAGANVLILRHPESVRMIREFIGLMNGSGSAAAIAGISKRLPEVPVDLAALAPEPELKTEEEAAKPAAGSASALPKPAPAPAILKPKPDPAAEAAARARAEKDAEAAARRKAEEEARAAAVEAGRLAAEKAKEEAAARARAEKDAEAAARRKAEEEARAAAVEAGRLAAEKAKEEAAVIAAREAGEERLRKERAARREERAAGRAKIRAETRKKTPAPVQKGPLEKLADRIQWVNRRK